MSYLSYPTSSETPVASATIDHFSRFQQTGNLLALKGLELGYNVVVFGVPTPDGLISFDRRPMLRGTDFPPSLGDVGKIIQQADGTVAIQWPL